MWNLDSSLDTTHVRLYTIFYDNLLAQWLYKMASVKNWAYIFAKYRTSYTFRDTTSHVGNISQQPLNELIIDDHWTEVQKHEVGFC